MIYELRLSSETGNGGGEMTGILNAAQGSTLCEFVHLRMFLSGREGEYVCISVCEREWMIMHGRAFDTA